MPECQNVFYLFFFNDTATTEIYTLSLHDALPISSCPIMVDTSEPDVSAHRASSFRSEEHTSELQSRVDISYAVFCLKKTQIYVRARLAPVAHHALPGGHGASGP